jgi:predicted nucleic acid-binding protein
MSPTLLSKARPTIILDTNLLFPASTRDLFVHLAIEGFFELLIPKVALEELGRTLQASGVISEENATLIEQKLEAVFGSITAPRWREAGSYTSDQNDWFLVECVRSFRPEFLVTRNTKDFAPLILDTRVISGATFLRDLFYDNREIFMREISAIVSRYQNPKVSIERYIAALQFQGFDWLEQEPPENQPSMS